MHHAKDRTRRPRGVLCSRTIPLVTMGKMHMREKAGGHKWSRRSATVGTGVGRASRLIGILQAELMRLRK